MARTGRPPATDLPSIDESLTRTRTKLKEATGGTAMIAEFLADGKPADIVRAALEAAERQVTVALQYLREAKRQARRVERAQLRAATRPQL